MNDKEQTVIIGAGPAGLTAAYELSKKTNHNISVFEELNDIGGISKTIEHNGNRMDIGGHRFFSKNDEIMQWWNMILPLQGKPSLDDILLEKNKKLAENGLNPEEEDRVMLIRQRVSRIFYLRKFFDYPISLHWQTFANMGLIRTLKAGFGYIYSSFRKRKETSLENFYINRFGKPLYGMFFENYTEKVWGIHPSNLGADWGAQRVKGLSLMNIIKDIITKPFRTKNVSQKKTETSLIETFIYPKYGPGQLWENVASDSEKNGVIIKKEHLVKQINIQNNKVVSVVVLHNNDEQTVTCDYLLSSMPVKDLVNAMKGIEIPNDIKRIASELPYRDFITVGLLVDKLLLKNTTKIKTWNNLVPDTWIYIQDSTVKLGRLQIFNNWSPYMVKDFKNTVWIGLEYFCNEGDEFWEMSDEDFIEFAVSELSKINIISKEDVKDAVRAKVRKAYPAYHGSYNELPKVIDFLNSITNLYCIGRNGQHRYNNMDHSMLTAMEAVNHITGSLKDKSIIWNVNAEKDYHEEK
ncbi:MAG: NAD(P)/FAD-dependent oxidoreductase [Prevotellaceae bacterium]|jgi:protoporphyrinogen oxidase|nr:NAD(P)/FAD-dependent oxidoreductase [Prevotellaceae bacterium]